MFRGLLITIVRTAIVLLLCGYFLFAALLLAGSIWWLPVSALMAGIGVVATIFVCFMIEDGVL